MLAWLTTSVQRRLFAQGHAPEVVAGAPGEPYIAARLLADLLPVLERDLRAPLAERVAARLDAMGAVTSAEEAAAYA